MSNNTRSIVRWHIIPKHGIRGSHADQEYQQRSSRDMAHVTRVCLFHIVSYPIPFLCHKGIITANNPGAESDPSEALVKSPTESNVHILICITVIRTRRLFRVRYVFQHRHTLATNRVESTTTAMLKVVLAPSPTASFSFNSSSIGKWSLTSRACDSQRSD